MVANSVVSNKQDIINVLTSNKTKFQQFGVSRLGLFGSFINDEQTKKSDVDLLVEFSEGSKNFRNFINTANLVESILGRQIDLVTPKALSKYIGPHIMKTIQYVQIT